MKLFVEKLVLKATLLTKVVLENFPLSLLILGRRQVYTIQIMKTSKNGGKLYTGSLKLNAQKDLVIKLEHRHVITRIMDGLVKHTLLNQMFSTMDEVLSSFHGTTTTERSQKCFAQHLTMVQCTFSNTQTRLLPTHIQSSHQLFGFI